MWGKHPHVFDLEVPILVELGRRTMTLREVQSLLPGAVIDLDKSSDDELSVLANNQLVATGYAVKVGENFGIRIARVGTAEELSQPLAEEDDETADAGEADADDLAAQFLSGQ